VVHPQASMRTPEDVIAFLRERGLPGQIHRFPQGTPSIQAAAQAAGLSPEQVLKSLLFFVADRPVLVLLRGPARADYKALARHFRVPRKRVRMARADEVLHWTGYPVGAVPPVALAHPVTVVIDPKVLEVPVVWAGGGAENALLEIPTQALLEATQATVVPVQKTEPQA